MNKERRTNDRTPCIHSWTKVSVVNPVRKEAALLASDIVKVKIDNISLSGVCLISEKPFELDQRLQFHEAPEQKIGIVVWTCQSKIECKAGIKFENVDG